MKYDRSRFVLFAADFKQIRNNNDSYYNLTKSDNVEREIEKITRIQCFDYDNFIIHHHPIESFRIMKQTSSRVSVLKKKQPRKAFFRDKNDFLPFKTVSNQIYCTNCKIKIFSIDVKISLKQK